METPAAVTQATAKPFYNIFPSFMHAHKTITSINIDEEDVASSTLRDDGCGCCMRDIKQHKVQTLEKAIDDMEEILCKSCVDEEDGLFRDRGKVYRRVE